MNLADNCHSNDVHDVTSYEASFATICIESQERIPYKSIILRALQLTRVSLIMYFAFVRSRDKHYQHIVS